MMTDFTQLYTLLGLCARPQGYPVLYRQLRNSVADLSDWEVVPHAAEAHGLAPLLYTHLQAAGITSPDHIRRKLLARYLQHAHANGVRRHVMAEVLHAFADDGIQVLLLKGMALAHLVYPDPALRVMSDMDLLVKKSDAHRAQAVLRQLGFTAPDPGEKAFRHHHMPVARRQVDGVSVLIELHHNLYEKQTPTATFEVLRPAAISLQMDGIPAYTLGCNDLLTHAYVHMVAAPFQPFRLIWIADLVALVEQFGTELDGYCLPARIRSALSVLNWLTPLDTVLPADAGFTIAPPPEEKAAKMQGWPLSILPAEGQEAYLRNAPEAFRPSIWWLRVNYGWGEKGGFAGVRAWHTLRLLWWLARFRSPWPILRRVIKYIWGRK
jgi:hypothetical protein